MKNELNASGRQRPVLLVVACPLSLTEFNTQIFIKPGSVLPLLISARQPYFAPSLSSSHFALPPYATSPGFRYAAQGVNVLVTVMVGVGAIVTTAVMPQQLQAEA